MLDQATRPLSKVKVLDFSQAWAAPIASMMLADLGADVAKVEPPGIGDHVRKWTRPDLHGLSPYYLSVNRNKRSVVIDLKSPEGRALALDLSERADVVLENFRPGTMDRLGLGYDTIAARNPGVVYCSVSGYGADGPYASRAAYDLLIQGEAGLLSVTGQEDGTLAKLGVPIADVMSANIAAFSILGALIAREHSQKGQRLDISMLEVATMTMSMLLVDYELSGIKARPMGSANQVLTPYQVYPTATSPIVIGVLTEPHWRAFCRCIGCDALALDERFLIAALRTANRDALNELIMPILTGRPAEAWLQALSEAGIACGLVRDVESIFSHPQHLARQFFQTFSSEGRPFRVPGVAWKVAPTPDSPTPPPEQGEHTAEILADWLDLPSERMDALIGAGAVHVHERSAHTASADAV